MVQSLQNLAPSYNVTITTVANYDITAANYDAEWNTMALNQIQTILVICSQFETVRIFRSAQNLGMLDGNYWIISALGWDQSMFTSNSASQAILGNMTGVWQVNPPQFYDATLLPSGANADAYAARQWWKSLWVPNSASANAGYPLDFNPGSIQAYANFTPIASNCAADPQLDIADVISPFPFTLASNPGVVYGAQGNLCTGSGGKYMLGYFVLFAALQGYNVETLNQYMWSTLTCGKMLAGLFDSVSKLNSI
jgi:hypothetical protein